MLYKGRLKVAGDLGEGIPIDLSLDDVFLDLWSEGDELGRWRLDAVDVSRLEGNAFHLALEGEDMIFLAADPLDFAYSGVTTIEEIGGRLRKKRVFRRKGEKRVGVVPQHVPPPEPDRAAVGATAPSPAPEPVPAEPMAYEALVETTPAGSDEEFFEEVGAVAYLDVDQYMSADVTEPEASTASTSTPERTAEPLEEPALDEDRLLVPGEPFDSVEPDVGRVATDTADGEVSVPLATADVAEGIDSDPVPDETESMDGEGESAADVDLDSLPQLEVVATAETFEGEEPVSDSLAEMLGFEGDTVDPRVDGAAAAEEAAEPVELSFEAVEESDDVLEPPEPRHVIAPAEERPVSTEPPSVSMRHGMTPTVSAAKKKSRFGRKSGTPDHAHDYKESKTVGGITRRVCSVCGHVSFASEDVYQDWS